MQYLLVILHLCIYIFVCVCVCTYTQHTHENTCIYIHLLNLALALIANRLDACLRGGLLLLAGVLGALERLMQASVFFLHLEDAVIVGALQVQEFIT